MNILSLKNINKSFAGHKVLKNISFEVFKGEFFTLLGPSGCGKTTILRLIAGFETPDSGEILLENTLINTLPPHKRNINTVFQSYTLFPHMTVEENIAFGLKMKKMPPLQIKEKISQALSMVKLAGFEKRYPHQLSGGQQQRIALARALVNEPKVLLLDEPFSALDYALRKEMRLELKLIQEKLGITFIFVTHDQEEALSLSDRVVVLEKGEIKQIGTPTQIYENPTSLEVAKFVGETNIFKAKIIDKQADKIFCVIGNKYLETQSSKEFQKNQEILIVLRPEDMQVCYPEESESLSQDFYLSGTIINTVYKGSTYDLIIELELEEQVIKATQFFNEDDEKMTYRKGEKVLVSWIKGWEVILENEN